MLRLPELTFYISHTCDLACANCFTYNNLNWGGHFLPPENVNKFKELASEVEFNEVFILGGEPTLNPHFVDWVNFVNTVWPNTKKWLVTNGRHLDNLIPNWWNNHWQLEISAHSSTDLKNIFDWFKNNISDFSYKKYHQQHEDSEWHYQLYHKNIIIGEISESWHFFQTSSIAKHSKPLSWKKLNDAEEQHKLCVAKECMYYIEGRFYRCFQQALLPHLTKKFKIDSKFYDIAKQDLGCEIHEFKTWIETRLEPQSQCQLCEWNKKIKLPEVPNIKKIKVSQL